MLRDVLKRVGAVVPVLAESGSPYCSVEEVPCWLINSALREVLCSGEGRGCVISSPV